MVRLQHRLVTEGLGLTRLRLVMGTSMGAMHAWMWGYMFPAVADGLVPLASNPVEIAGRNRMWRKALVDAIVTDPTWQGGNYTEPPRGMASALGFLLIATSTPMQWQKQWPTADADSSGSWNFAIDVAELAGVGSRWDGGSRSNDVDRLIAAVASGPGVADHAVEA
jgi:homoserine acetyltransferase